MPHLSREMYSWRSDQCLTWFRRQKIRISLCLAAAFLIPTDNPLLTMKHYLYRVVSVGWIEWRRLNLKKKIDWLHWFFSFAAYISGQFLNDALYRKPAYSCYCRIDDSMKQHSLPTLMFCVLTQTKVKAVRLFFSRAGSLFFSSCNQPANSYLLEQQWIFVFCNNCVHTILHNSLHKSRLVWWSGLS